jgi:hypothetical protein
MASVQISITPTSNPIPYVITDNRANAYLAKYGGSNNVVAGIPLTRGQFAQYGFLTAQPGDRVEFRNINGRTLMGRIIEMLPYEDIKARYGPIEIPGLAWPWNSFVRIIFDAE